MYIILYDAKCPLCNAAIAYILQEDKKHLFLFAPLGGKTAKKYTDRLDSLVLIDNGKLFFAGKGALRILWRLSGTHKILGTLSFLPQFLSDPIYQFIAERRYSLFKEQRMVDPKDHPDRFLP